MQLNGGALLLLSSFGDGPMAFGVLLLALFRGLFLEQNPSATAAVNYCTVQ